MMRGEADADGLIAAAATLLEAEVAPGLAGEARFRTLMAIAALRMAERERALAGRLVAADAEVLAAAGAASLEELREMLRRPDARLGEGLHRVLHADAAMRTAVTKPGALMDDERKTAGLF